MVCVIVTVVCKSWCAGHKQAWGTKCKWSETCGGCSECFGLYIEQTLLSSVTDCHDKFLASVVLVCNLSLFRIVCVSKPKNNIMTHKTTPNKQNHDNDNTPHVAELMSWQSHVKETEVPKTDGCNNKTDGSRDCEQHSQLTNKAVNVVTDASACVRVNVSASVFVCLLVLVLGLQ